MLKYIYIIAFLHVGIAGADDLDAKELFNEADCTSCHALEYFKSREEKVNSFKKLSNVVEKCQFNTNTGWFEEETKGVVLYLNQDFYHFKNPDLEK